MKLDASLSPCAASSCTAPTLVFDNNRYCAALSPSAERFYSIEGVRIVVEQRSRGRVDQRRRLAMEHSSLTERS